MVEAEPVKFVATGVALNSIETLLTLVGSPVVTSVALFTLNWYA